MLRLLLTQLENILLKGNDVTQADAKLADFGLSALVRKTAAFTLMQEKVWCMGHACTHKPHGTLTWLRMCALRAADPPQAHALPCA